MPASHLVRVAGGRSGLSDRFPRRWGPLRGASGGWRVFVPLARSVSAFLVEALAMGPEQPIRPRRKAGRIEPILKSRYGGPWSGCSSAALVLPSRAAGPGEQATRTAEGQRPPPDSTGRPRTAVFSPRAEPRTGPRRGRRAPRAWPCGPTRPPADGRHGAARSEPDEGTLAVGSPGTAPRSS